MAILKDAERVEAGQALKQMSTQATNAINQLKGLKTNFIALRDKVTADTVNYTADDIAEITTRMTELNTAIGNI